MIDVEVSHFAPAAVGHYRGEMFLRGHDDAGQPYTEHDPAHRVAVNVDLEAGVIVFGGFAMAELMPITATHAVIVAGKDLPVDPPSPGRPHVCRIVGGSVSLNGSGGLSYSLAAQIEWPDRVVDCFVVFNGLRNADGLVAGPRVLH